MSEPVSVVIIGGGQRGKAYGRYAIAYPHLCKIAAIAEPRPRTREFAIKQYQLPESGVFATWQDLHAASARSVAETGKPLADAICVCVQDQMHVEVVEAFAGHGYHILCEKPLATTAEECIRIAEVAKKAGCIFGVGHVMRYSPYNKAVIDVIRSGQLGKPVNIVHVEPVGYFHFAHSFVRGNWNNEKTSSFSLLTKSCHDLDILCHYLNPETPKRVSSFGSLTHFRKEAKPTAAGDATKCLECADEQNCAYSAKKIYVDPVSKGSVGWPAATITDGVPDIESITEAMKGPYGTCVYESGNNVCDHQVVNLEYSDGSTCSFTMVAFTEEICARQTRIHFTHGQLVGDMSSFTIHDFRTGNVSTVAPKPEDQSGHGGGDWGLMGNFVRAVKEKNQEILGTTVDEILKSHLTVFAAEKSRRDGVVIDVEQYEKEVREGMKLWD
ncbi:NADP-binding protein [Dacryopinax primogenitus]|uniref:NADP-binding protein n=1 Tax=Dacryopinax primogenitus (strain DJM 731) TaxID=1858805 RepID=M5G2G5_DACPD|nr:NADP-binding protein [Dacryopinax primogenitus]EJU00052.1 NADP-binding protein [Dacryopinax primogenitus]